MPDPALHNFVRPLGFAVLTVGLALSGARTSDATAAPLVPVAASPSPFAVSPSPEASAPSDRSVSVIVNGTAVVFDQPPITRDGRVYVPLRGIFERLGAGVVFNAGHIAVSAGSHAVALAIGDTSATVDGKTQLLDAPPIVVAGRTLVPLRFISQALGATVAYDATARTVAVDLPPFAKPLVADTPIATSTPTAAPIGTPRARAEIALRSGETPIAIRLLRIEPAPSGKIADGRPEISATFAESVAPRSLRFVLDGTDVTAETESSPRSFSVVPAAALAPGEHEISLAGRTAGGDPFVGHWTFETTVATNTNYLSGLEPTSGTKLPSTQFDVSGYTQPNARVRIVGTTSPASTAFADGTDASAVVETVADRSGYFSARIALADRGTDAIDVRIVSIAPGNAVAVRTLRLRR